MKYYAGIGSRETPDNVCTFMTRIAGRLNALGYTLRSGGAQGADSAFERGAGDAKEIYLPWRRFNNHPSSLCYPSNEAVEMAARFHPNWAACSSGARALHARNCHQILGADLQTPVEFVVCWTLNGLGGGGTGQARRIARYYSIPIFDLGHGTEVLDELAQLIRKNAL